MSSQLPKRERDRVMDRFLEMDVGTLVSKVDTVNKKHLALTTAIGSLLQDFNMVSYIPLDPTDPESVGTLLAQIDNSIQYGDDIEPKCPEDMAEHEPSEASMGDV